MMLLLAITVDIAALVAVEDGERRRLQQHQLLSQVGLHSLIRDFKADKRLAEASGHAQTAKRKDEDEGDEPQVVDAGSASKDGRRRDLAAYLR